MVLGGETNELSRFADNCLAQLGISSSFQGIFNPTSTAPQGPHERIILFIPRLPGLLLNHLANFPSHSLLFLLIFLGPSTLLILWLCPYPHPHPLKNNTHPVFPGYDLSWM